MEMIGLTGSIGSGKSTVAALLAAMGFPVLDADQIAHEALEAREEEICAAFPEACSGGKPDRAKLAELVFNDPQKRHELEAITHPYVGLEIFRRLEAYRNSENPPRAVVLDIPLLLESGMDSGMPVLLITAPAETRAPRVAERSGITRADFLARDAQQMNQEEKARRATWVIENSGSLAELKTQVQEWAQSAGFI
jgi:dephospho-CoA kinase